MVDYLAQGSQPQAKAIGAQLIKIDRDIEKLFDRVVDASVPSVIAAYEDRIRSLEEEKIVLREKASKLARPASSFDDTLRTAMAFLSNPWNLWDSERLEDRRAVLKLAFAERLVQAKKLRQEAVEEAHLIREINRVIARSQMLLAEADRKLEAELALP